jgi:hypothetical protein
MSHLKIRLATFALLTGVASLPSFAASSITSLASDSLSRSSGSISDSISGSSHASSPENRQMLGQLKVIDLIDVPNRPNMVALRLQPMVETATAEDQYTLTLPREAVAAGHVAKDGIVTAMQRPYGIEYASGEPHSAFFLALADDWVRDLKMAPLAL